MLDVTRAYGLNFLFPERDFAIGHSLKTHGEFAVAEVEMLAGLLNAEKPGTFIDVGANIGAICLPLASGRKSWRVIAVEAHRGLAQVLSANAFGNHLYNVEVVNAAIGDRDAIVDFPALRLNETGNFGVIGFGLRTEAPTEKVRMATLDGFAPDDTRIVKVDVEGFEPQVLAGAKRMIETVRPVWLLEADVDNRREATEEVRRALMAADYDLFWFYSPFANIKAPRKPSPVRPRIQGDGAILAAPKGTPGLWPLPKIERPDEPWPSDPSLHPHAARYGLVPE